LVAVSFTLLIGAGLMLRSFLKLSEVKPGFRTDHLLALRMTPNFAKYSKKPEQFPNLTADLMHHIRSINGVASAAMVSNPPFSPFGIASGPGNEDFNIAGKPLSQGELAPQVDRTIVDQDYFATIGQPLVSGRVFTERDDAAAMAVGVINQTIAKHRWPAEDPIGQRVAFASCPDGWITIVGVVGDTREYGLASPTKDEIYLPTAQQGGFSNNLVVRTAFESAAATPLIRAAVREVDPFIGLDQIGTMDQFESESMAPPRVTTTLLGIFAALALLISVGGIAAVMTLSVTQRSRELGIRMALGAERSSIVALVMREGLRLAIIGIGFGIAGAMALTRLLSTLLYATSPTDVPTFLLVSLLFLSVGAAACFVPVRHVTSIDPLTALRDE
jgi:predicted permease